MNQITVGDDDTAWDGTEMSGNRATGAPRSGPGDGGLIRHGGSQNPWLVLIVLCAAIFMLLLDTTIVNVAQRKIQVGLGANLSEIQWVLDSYILTYAVLLLALGRMGDIFGRKRLFVIGMSLFTLASALCGVAGWAISSVSQASTR